MNKVILITGASSGMGKETAGLLVQHGFTVYAAARRTAMMDDLQALGCKIIHIDVASEPSMVKAVTAVIEAEGKINVLINNAGYAQYGAVESVPLSDARHQLEVNLFGAARLIQLVIPYMRHHRSGKIINISSIGGRFATPLGGWYHASKYALEGLSDSLRNELKPFGIDVVVIQPGGVQSEWMGIALGHLNEVSDSTPYQQMAGRFSALSMKESGKVADPLVIAKLDRLIRLKTNEAITLLLQHQPGFKNLLFNYNEPAKVDIEQFMTRNFRFNVSTAQFAQLTGRSITVFKRDFEKVFKSTPGRWLQKSRLEEAYFLIKQRGLKPSEVYLNVGFENLSHFSYAFKNEFGIPPSYFAG